MSEILVAGSELLQFGQYTDGTGNITKNDDGSMVCKTTNTSSRAYLYWKRPIELGEAIILKVRGKALSVAARNDTSPRCNILWYRKNGSTIVSQTTGNFLNSNDFTEETLILNINQPVKVGDYVQIGFGCFASSKTDVIIQSASVSVVNSSLPVRRVALQALITIPASGENTIPIPVINNNFNKVGDMVFSFENGKLKITSDRLRNTSSTCSTGYFLFNPILDSVGSYKKYYPVIGSQDRVNGCLYVEFIDRATNNAVDFTLIKNQDLYYQFSYEVL